MVVHGVVLRICSSRLGHLKNSSICQQLLCGTQMLWRTTRGDWFRNTRVLPLAISEASAPKPLELELCRPTLGDLRMRMRMRPFVSRVAVVSVAAASIAIVSGCGKQDAENARPPTSMESMTDNNAASNQESMKDIPMTDTSAPGASAENQAHVTKGRIQSVDRDAGTVKIAHEAVPGLNWPAMTMDFKLANQQDLATLKEGEQVEFRFTEESAGRYAITEISPQR